jgi:hypothetical protein
LLPEQVDCNGDDTPGEAAEPETRPHARGPVVGPGGRGCGSVRRVQIAGFGHVARNVGHHHLDAILAVGGRKAT